LRLDANLSESKRSACLIQSKLTQGLAGNKSRGVRQALFHVLLGADMPSVLVEAGFLSNPKDRALVLSQSGRRSIGMALAEAVKQFKDARGNPRAHAQVSNCKVH
jgi:N-acetylmuramoyl-L-alanine amidase